MYATPTDPTDSPVKSMLNNFQTGFAALAVGVGLGLLICIILTKRYFWYLAFLVFVGWFTVQMLNPPLPPQGTCIEKYWMPPFQNLFMIDVERGEGLVEDDPSPKVFKIKTDVRVVPEQWILKISWTNLSGRPATVFIKVPKATWLSNHPGRLFHGDVYEERPIGL